MNAAILRHWPEYLIEAAGLAFFMVSAGLFSVLIFSPASPLAAWMADPLLRRLAMGLAMGATAIAIVYSPWGMRSGAHLNPAFTFVFWRLGKIETHDAVMYGIAQFAGGVAGVLLVAVLLGAPFAEPPVLYAATLPGPGGPITAWIAEILIAFAQMTAVLVATNTRRLHRYTGVITAVLLAAWITFESPVSGTSLNPARTFGSALPAGLWDTLWIYLTAPLAGMMLASAAYRGVRRAPAIRCAKMHHANHQRCIFRCGYAAAGCRSRLTPGPPETEDDRMPWSRPDRLRTARLRLASRMTIAAAKLLFTISLVLPARLAALDTDPTVSAVVTVGCTVSDMERSVAFFEDVLRFEVIADAEVTGEAWERLNGVFPVRMRVVRMRLGSEEIELTEYLAPRGRSIPQDLKSNDRSFQHIAIVVRDIEAAYRKLREHRVTHVSSGPQRLPDWNPDAGGISAFYFRDPDGHALEIIHFPPGKGDPRWQKPTDQLFLGIDHTAIVVDDTDTSLRFYRDVLGFEIAGGAENYGTEQEHLNAVFGARLRITALRVPGGPGVEFLEYISPSDGRPMPADEKASDIAHWQTTLVTADIDALVQRLRAGAGPFISPGIVEVEPTFGFRRAAMVRDPDGHVMRIIERAAPPANGTKGTAP
ncbi:MAG: aquaporin [Gemmatimonadetes bacterium]|nr:aquaporin [Gemmatimonadota bacterium]